MKSHTRSRSGRDTVIINIEQPVKCIVYNSAPITHINMRCEDPPWQNRNNWTDSADFGLMPIKHLFIVAQLYREVVIMK